MLITTKLQNTILYYESLWKRSHFTRVIDNFLWSNFFIIFCSRWEIHNRILNTDVYIRKLEIRKSCSIF